MMRHRPEHGLARLLRGRDGEESHQDVRQAGRAEHERHAERDLVDRRLEVRPGSRKRWPSSAADMFFAGSPSSEATLRLHLRVVDHVLQECRQRKPVRQPHQDDEHDRRRHEQDRLDDLHPGRRHHAAEQHVGEHQHADGDHRDLVVDADQRLHQHAATDHLRGQVERGDRDHRNRADDAHRPRVVAIGEDVGSV